MSLTVQLRLDFLSIGTWSPTWLFDLCCNPSLLKRSRSKRPKGWSENTLWLKPPTKRPKAFRIWKERKKGVDFCRQNTTPKLLIEFMSKSVKMSCWAESRFFSSLSQYFPMGLQDRYPILNGFLFFLPEMEMLLRSV